MQTTAARGYQTANVGTADRLRIVILCYEGAIANAGRALEEMKKSAQVMLQSHPWRKFSNWGGGLPFVPPQSAASAPAVPLQLVGTPENSPLWASK